MKVKKDPKELLSSLELVQAILEGMVSEYIKEYADYGWDSFTEDLSCISAQLYKDEIMLKNAEVEDAK